MQIIRRLVGPVLLLLPLALEACAAEQRPTNTTSVSAPLDAARPMAGLEPEPITIPQSAQSAAYNTLRTALNEGTAAIDGGDRAKTGDALARSRAGYESDFVAPTRSADADLNDRILKADDAMAAAAKDGASPAYRISRYVIDVGILRLATLRTRALLGSGDRSEAEKWFSVVANRFDLAKDVQPLGAAWKRVQSGPLDAATQKVVNLSLGGYLATKMRGELKGAVGGLDEKNAAKARWELSGGMAYYDAIKEIVQQQLGAGGAKKMLESLQGADTAIVGEDDARARTLLQTVTAQLD
ncbi:MAG TPA: hypothetical protein VNK05_14430, partial [Chloroflexota bacterium]|nr:hypothetical protein [Chloroflexota bacterium]